MKKWLIIIAVALPNLVSGVRAQFLWESIAPDADWRYSSGIEDLSCDGNNCSTTGMSWDKLKRIYINLIRRSTDGGISWILQDPGLPWSLGSNTASELYRIQQIDSLNVTSVGDSGLITRTFDGGKNWQLQDCHSKSRISAINFFDSLTGILTEYNSVSTYSIQTTTNGGRQWNQVLTPVDINTAYLWGCHSYGGGKFRVFRAGGPIYTTLDNWKTTNSSASFIDHVIDTSWRHYEFYNCEFSGGDTIIAFGAYHNTGYQGVVVRSVDGGLHWEKPWIFPDPSQIVYLSPVGRDTIIAAGTNKYHILMSFNHGETWRVDSLLLKEEPKFPLNNCRGLAWGSTGPIAAFSGNGQRGAEVSLLHEVLWHSSVDKSPPLDLSLSIYPNPASSEVTVSSQVNCDKICIFDLLGRKVAESKLSSDGKAHIDVSGLDNTSYQVATIKGEHIVSRGRLIVITQ
ncbi:MAG: T9SS type A sorting domain-containing protein [Ignavibacteriota bacterium]